MTGRAVNTIVKSVCFGTAMTAFLPIGRAFHLPDYETHYTSGNVLFNRWKQRNGDVFQKAYEEIYGKIASGNAKYKYNSDKSKQQKMFGRFNTYFGTSLWRKRPRKKEDLEQQIPQIICLRVPCYSNKDAVTQMYHIYEQTVQKAYDMNAEFSEAYDKLASYGCNVPTETKKYIKDCLCTAMSEEFLRKTLTGEAVDRLLAYHAEEIRKEKGKIPSGRYLEIRYDLTFEPGDIKADCTNSDIWIMKSIKEFSINIHICDIEERIDDSENDRESYEGRGAYFISKTGDEGSVVKSRKNLNIDLTFVFDPKGKVLRRVELKDKFVVNAQLITNIDCEKPLRLRQTEEP